MENKLHFLLIHGAWHGSWAWENVSSKLSEKNFKVSCPNSVSYTHLTLPTT